MNVVEHRLLCIFLCSMLCNLAETVLHYLKINTMISLSKLHSYLATISCDCITFPQDCSLMAIAPAGMPVTGIDDPYEEPQAAELVLEAVDASGKHVTPQVSAGKILEYLHAQQII